MAYICYEPYTPRLTHPKPKDGKEPKHRYSAREDIEWADRLCRQYAANGQRLTVRQIYYRFVAADRITNCPESYNRIKDLLLKARMGGYIDWDHIEDRTRYLRANNHWDTPGEIIESAAVTYRRDKWADQNVYCEAWIEKDALVGILESVTLPLDVPAFACRGDTSTTAVHDAAVKRFMKRMKAGKRGVIFHLADHDPKGLDMTPDITNRLTTFCHHHGYPAPTVLRLGLNWDQITPDLPPNRIEDESAGNRRYRERYGGETWELDALEPAVIATLVENAIRAHRDDDLWEESAAREDADRAALAALAAKPWAHVLTFVNGDEADDLPDETTA
jgi:hypothetical protein